MLDFAMGTKAFLKVPEFVLKFRPGKQHYFLVCGGKNLLSVLQSEGLSEKEYQYFLKKVKTITGKKIKELY